MREEDLVARPGGDEFTVVCTRTATDHAIAEVAQRLVDAVVEPFEIDGHEVFLTASVGVAVSEHGRETAGGAAARRRRAMYRAKELGGGRFEAFDIALRHRLVERMTIEGDLRHAVERDQLELHYQPLVELDDERVVGFEALLRWRHPERGLMTPGEFIHDRRGDRADRADRQLGAAHRLRAARALARARSTCRPTSRALQITPELVVEVERAARAAIASRPARLVLEITESLVLDPRTKPVVASLRALGVQLALDDFGTGYSSLGSLQRFPLDVVKPRRASAVRDRRKR